MDDIAAREPSYVAQLDTVLANPFSFAVPDPVYHFQFFVADLNGDQRPDYTYRSENSIYAFDHLGRPMWHHHLPNPQFTIDGATIGEGTVHGAGDIDVDGAVEVVALDDANRLLIYDGASGELERTVTLPTPGPNLRWVYVAVASLRGPGDGDVILQSFDVTGKKPAEYLGRSLLAWDLEQDRELWQLVHDVDPANGLYDTYWGPSHKRTAHWSTLAIRRAGFRCRKEGMWITSTHSALGTSERTCPDWSG